VLWFAGEMERQLRANDHKGGWSRDKQHGLLARLREETQELSAEILAMQERDPYQVVKEAADVANFAMMIADNERVALSPEEPSHE
jgi:NTP pyrophosphatase (non-canonical NTP hydrolase)